jgi:hypothetical protein
MLVHAVLGALYVTTFFLVMLCAAAAVGISAEWPQLFVDAPLLFLAQNVPITFGGLGSREFGFLVMLGPLLGEGGAVAMSLVVGLAAGSFLFIAQKIIVWLINLVFDAGLVLSLGIWFWIGVCLAAALLFWLGNSDELRRWRRKR